MATMHPKQWQQPWKPWKWSKCHWHLKNKQYTLENSENDKNTPKLSQNILDSLDFGGILAGSSCFSHSLRF